MNILPNNPDQPNPDPRYSIYVANPFPWHNLTAMEAAGMVLRMTYDAHKIDVRRTRYGYAIFADDKQVTAIPAVKAPSVYNARPVLAARVLAACRNWVRAPMVTITPAEVPR